MLSIQNQIIKKIDLNQKIPQNIIHQAFFQIISNKATLKKVKTFLCQNCIILFAEKDNPTERYKISFQFDLKFQFINKSQKKGIWYIQSCDSLIFQKSQQILIFQKPQKIQDFRVYRANLIKKLNQKGFHDQFKPIKQIGSGNYATVYLVQNNETKLKFASKALVKNQLYSQQYGKQAIISEIQILRQIQHKNIIKTHSIFETKNTIYINTEYLKGGQLFQRYKNNMIENKLILKRIMKSLMKGVQYLHQKNIVHRDLKLDNILFKDQESYESIIIDFGFAAKIEKGKMFPKCGTPGYMAPEIINLKHHESTVQKSSDIFSCGVIFYALLFGKLIFQGNTLDQIIQKNQKCQVELEQQEHIYQLPKIWIDLLKGMLQKDPQKRLKINQILQHQFFKDTDRPEVKKISLKQQNEFTLDEISQKMKSDLGSEESPLILGQNRKRKNMLIMKNDKLINLKVTNSKQNLKINKQNIQSQYSRKLTYQKCDKYS